MLSLTPTRAWVAGTVAVCVLLSLASYFLLIAPKRAEAAELDLQTASTVTSNALLATRVDELRAQFAELPEREAELAAIKQAMPEDAALPTLIRDLDVLTAAAGVTFMSLTPGVAAATATDVAVAPTDTAAPADAAATPADGTAAATDGTAGELLVSIPVSLVTVGTFAQSELFLNALQTELPRAFLVTGLTVTAETGAAEASAGRPAVVPGDVTMTLTGTVFVLRPAGAAAATPAVVEPPTVTN